MATWVVGDVHGCVATLKKLWRRLDFDSSEDRLWLVGDVVNRGPASLEVLLWLRKREKKLGDRLQIVLGNHDLHLLACHYGVARQRSGDTLREILKHPKRAELVDWLARRPLLVEGVVERRSTHSRTARTLGLSRKQLSRVDPFADEKKERIMMVHAGLLPEWRYRDARKQARILERILQSDTAWELLARGRSAATRKRKGKRRRPRLGRKRHEELRSALEGLTRIRTCDPWGKPHRFSGPPSAAPKGLTPWWKHPERRSRRTWGTVVFGHWAALGLHAEQGALALDSGCAWGGKLTAVRLEDRRIVQVRNLDQGR